MDRRPVLIRAAVIMMVAAAATGAGAGGFALGEGRAPHRPPATLAQAIEEASAGQLPLGAPVTDGTGAGRSGAPSPTTSTPPASIPPVEAQEMLTFRGTAQQVSPTSLVVETQAGPVTVALDGRTRYSAVAPVPRRPPGLAPGRSVIVVPATPVVGQAPSRAAVVLVLPGQ